jgi:hypothetical protein
MREAERRLRSIEQRQSRRGPDLSAYRGRYRDYCIEVLGFTPWEAQERLVGGMFRPPYRSLGRAGHGVGKSRAAASAISFIYDTLDPVMVVSTAPREESVKNIVWREVHDLRAHAGLPGFKSDVSMELRSSPQHFAIGMTARDAYSFHGKHLLRNYFILDEAEGIKPEFWSAAQSMMMGEAYGLLAIYNPYTTSCQAYAEEMAGNCNLTVISCLDHPNIALQLAGKPPLIPSAVSLDWVMSELALFSEVVSADEADENCFEFPPRTAHKSVLAVYPPRWWRITPHVAIRVFGRWPPEGADTVWNEALFDRCRANRIQVEPHWRSAIGVDVARFGDDLTEIGVRRGPCLVHMESHSGWNTAKTASRLKRLCHEFRGPEPEQAVRVYVDEPGIGGAVVDQGDGYNFIGINPSWSLKDIPGEVCHNVRAKLWWDGKTIAQQGVMDLSRLTEDQAKELKRQLLVQTYFFKEGTEGKIALTEKKKIKELLKRSPDTADQLNLTYCQLDLNTVETVGGSLA